MSVISEQSRVIDVVSMPLAGSVEGKFLGVQFKQLAENSGLSKFVKLYRQMLIGYENAISDSYSSFVLSQYTKLENIRRIVASNEHIRSILKINSMKEEINVDNVIDIKSPHLLPTLVYSRVIMSKLAKRYKFVQYEKQAVEQAAVVHDIGKIFIPKDILDKPAKLTDDERRIVETHSQLGYELLKAQNCNETTANIVDNHHRYMDGSGYSSSTTKANILSQIVTVADKYSALRSKRSYKDPKDSGFAVSILKQDVVEGRVSAEVFEALLQSVA